MTTRAEPFHNESESERHGEGGCLSMRCSNSQLTASMKPRTRSAIGSPTSRMTKGTSRTIPHAAASEINGSMNVRSPPLGPERSLAPAAFDVLWSASAATALGAALPQRRCAGPGRTIPGVQEGGSLAGKDSARTSSSARSAANLLDWTSACPACASAVRLPGRHELLRSTRN